MGELIRAANVDLTQADAQRFSSLKRAGFDAISLSINDDIQFTGRSIRQELSRVAILASEQALKVVAMSLRSGDSELAVSACPPHSRAFERTCELLKAAEAIDVAVFIIPPPPVLCNASSAPGVAYRDALNGVFEVLKAMSPVAESVGSVLAVRAPSQGCLLSPVEVSELIDLVNVACVGVCIDVETLRPIGRLADWLATLRHRVTALSLTKETLEAHREQLESLTTRRCIAIIETL